MRPIAKLALAATVLTAFATTRAAAAPAFIKFDGVDGEFNKDGRRLDVESFHWGTTQAKGKVEFEWKVEEGESAPPGDPDRPIIAGRVPNASAVGANEKLTVGGGRTEASGQATGKRQHLPIRARTYYDQPLAKGSVWVRVATPWTACRVGARFPSIELGGAKRYVLQDVTVASCGRSGDADDRPTEEVAFYYNKVTVRGWDPKKKEE